MTRGFERVGNFDPSEFLKLDTIRNFSKQNSPCIITITSCWPNNVAFDLVDVDVP